MLKINESPDYYNIITLGTYDKHEFRITDNNNKISIYFKDHYKETNVEEFSRIIDQIKEQYLKIKKSKNPLFL
jgi:hypothetical protein